MGKAAGALRWPPTSFWRKCCVWVELYLRLPSLPAWHVTGRRSPLLVPSDGCYKNLPAVVINKLRQILNSCLQRVKESLANSQVGSRDVCKSLVSSWSGARGGAGGGGQLFGIPARALNVTITCCVSLISIKQLCLPCLEECVCRTTCSHLALPLHCRKLRWRSLAISSASHATLHGEWSVTGQVTKLSTEENICYLPYKILKKFLNLPQIYSAALRNPKKCTRKWKHKWVVDMGPRLQQV
jgi:hypothetical protein